MDGSRFDCITRALATGATRRRALFTVGGSALAGLLGLAGVEDAAAGCVKPGKKGCKGPKNGKCCTGARCQGGSNDKEGKCKCKGSLKQCGSKCVNTKTDKKNCGGCGKTCKGQNTCKNGVCTSKLGCKKGQNICSDPIGPDPFCPGDATDSCLCFTDLNGTAFCSDLTVGICSTCTSNADCGPGNACVDGSGINCECDEEPGSNGNACVNTTCDGLSGSSGGRRRLTTPLLR